MVKYNKYPVSYQLPDWAKIILRWHTKIIAETLGVCVHHFHSLLIETLQAQPIQLFPLTCAKLGNAAVNQFQGAPLKPLLNSLPLSCLRVIVREVLEKFNCCISGYRASFPESIMEEVYPCPLISFIREFFSILRLCFIYFLLANAKLTKVFWSPYVMENLLVHGRQVASSLIHTCYHSRLGTLLLGFPTYRLSLSLFWKPPDAILIPALKLPALAV